MLTFAQARRLILLGAGGALVAAGGIAPATTATADSNCYVQLRAQSQIAITGPYRDVIVGLNDPCDKADYASFYEYGPAGFDNIFIFDGNTTDHWDIYDDQTTGIFNTRFGVRLRR